MTTGSKARKPIMHIFEISLISTDKFSPDFFSINKQILKYIIEPVIEYNINAIRMLFNKPPTMREAILVAKRSELNTNPCPCISRTLKSVDIGELMN